MMAALQHAVRNLGRRRLRTALGVLGIFLTLALLTAIRIGLDSISASYTDLVALQAGKADLVITAEGGNPFQPVQFSAEEAERRLADNPLLRGLAPRWTGIVRVGSTSRETDALLIGLNPERERELDISGLVPDPTLPPGNCAVSRALADRLKLEPGTDVMVRPLDFGPELKLRLETVVQRQLLVPQEVRDFVVLNETDARSLLGQPEGVHALAGALRDSASYYDARELHGSVLALKRAGETVAALLGTTYEVRLPKAIAITAFEQFSSPLQAVFGVFALLALSVAGLLVYSILSVAVEERIREYAILRTLGGKRRDVFGMVLIESLLLCLLGVVPGVLAGVGVAHGIVTVAEWAWHAPPDVIEVRVSSATIGWTLGLGAALALGSALLPALQAVRWRIVDALDPLRRGQIRTEPRPESAADRPLLLAGLGLSVLAIVVFFVLPTAVLSGDLSLVGTVVLCLLLAILLGFTLLAVAVLPWITRGMMGLTGWCFGPAAEMAGRNLLRHRRRNRTTALMFILAVSLVIFVASLVVLFSRTSMTLVEHLNGADLRLESGAPRTSTLKPDLTRIQGVEQVSEVRWLRSRSEYGVANDIVLSDLVGMKHLWVVPFGVDADLDGVLFTNGIEYAEGGPEALAALREYPAERPTAGADRSGSESPPLVLSLSAARFLDARAGDRVNLSFRMGSSRVDRRFQIAAVCSALPGFDNFRSRVARAVGSGLLIPAAVFDDITRSVPEDAFQGRYFLRTSTANGVQQTVARHIREEFDIRYRFGVKSVVERQHEARVLYWVTQILFGLLLAVAVVISVFALIASMATAVIERRWEVGVLKALGLRRAQLFRMFLAEAVVLTLSAGVAGGAIGFTLAYLFVVEAAMLMEIPLVFTMPYVTFLATVAVSLVAGAVAAHLPTRRLLRQPAAEILRLES